jgi:hypothetical protein
MAVLLRIPLIKFGMDLVDRLIALRGVQALRSGVNGEPAVAATK